MPFFQSPPGPLSSHAMLLNGAGHPALPNRQKDPKGIHSTWPSPRTKLAPPECLAPIPCPGDGTIVKYWPLLSPKLSSAASRKTMVVAGATIRSRRKPIAVSVSSCRQVLVPYQNIGDVGVGVAFFKVALGQTKMLRPERADGIFEL